MPAAASARPSAANAAEERHREPRLHDLLTEDLAGRDWAAQGLLRIHRKHRGTHGIEEQVGIPGGAPHRQHALGRSDDRIRQDDCRQRFIPEAGIARVGDDPDDGDFRCLRRIGERAHGRSLEDAEPQPGANRILAGGPQPRSGLVDERDAIAAASLGRIEHAAATQGDTIRPQVIRAHQVERRAASIRQVCVPRS